VEIVPHTLADYNISLERRQVDIDVTLNFRFKDVNVVAMRRYQPLTFVEFLAQSGGMMGLFAGISALSIIEIF
jgi:Amiloride-sensitive sodium channel